MPRMRSRASSMSRRVGAVLVANPEHLLHDLAHRRQGIELAALHFVEEPTQLRVVRDRALEMRLRARGRNCEHLAGEVAPPALVELAAALEERAVLRELLPERVDVLAGRRLGE